MDIVETEKGRLLRELAEATDAAEAFRNWPAQDRLVSWMTRPVSPGNFYTETATDAADDMSDAIREHAQAKLDGKVASLQAEIDALDRPEPSVTALRGIAKAKSVTAKPAPKKARR